ncbi:Uncharacterized protein TCM_019686 [Theobroma cacao]|uniref:Secreted protein n=1 Tax=Theobroma cacao TaxID=3641 RepID=A0A061EHC8_THECC|nr:Uncharacterized protein TCM_019686 [Theobroma cacao]
MPLRLWLLVKPIYFCRLIEAWGGTRNCVAEMGICREDRDRTAASRSSSSSSSPSFGLLLISHSTKMFATQKRVQLSSNFCLWKSLSCQKFHR